MLYRGNLDYFSDSAGAVEQGENQEFLSFTCGTIFRKIICYFFGVFTVNGVTFNISGLCLFIE